MNKMHLFVPLLFMVLAFVACDKETDPAYVDVPIIESYLKSGEHLSLKISHSIPFTDGVTMDTIPLDGLQVYISDGISTYLLNDYGNGIYADSMVQVQENNIYDLTLQYGTKQVTAYTTVPSKPTNYLASANSIKAFVFNFDSTSAGGTPPEREDPIELTWDNPDASYYLLVVESIENNPELINDTTENSDRPSRSFRNSVTQSNTAQVQQMQFNYYGAHNVILYHLNADYASLYDESSNSSQNLTSPKSTISNGLGIFTATNSDTLQITVLRP